MRIITLKSLILLEKNYNIKSSNALFIAALIVLLKGYTACHSKNSFILKSIFNSKQDRILKSLEKCSTVSTLGILIRVS